MRATVSEDDPILEVTGIAAAEVLDRCARIRAGETEIGVGERSRSVTRAQSSEIEVLRKKKAWHLADFGQGTKEEFIQNAYVALLGRAVTEKEVRLRLQQLSAGKTRLGIMAGLMFSPESHKHNPKVQGAILEILKKISRYMHRLKKNAAHIKFTDNIIDEATSAIFATQKVPVVGDIVEILVTLPKIGRMRRDLMKLKDEIRQLNARIER